jgi:hypothetical protein
MRLLRSHEVGELPLDELALEFRVLHWQEVASACLPGMEAAAPAIDDPEPYVPGSFDLGMLSDDEYAVLAPAAVRALREHTLTWPGSGTGLLRRTWDRALHLDVCHEGWAATGSCRSRADTAGAGRGVP